MMRSSLPRRTVPEGVPQPYVHTGSASSLKYQAKASEPLRTNSAKPRFLTVGVIRSKPFFWAQCVGVRLRSGALCCPLLD